MPDRKIQTDEQLVAAFLDGHTAAFDELVDRYYRQVFAFLAKFLGRNDAAEDITQEIFVKINNSLATFDTTKSFKPWLFAVAANRARDALRAGTRQLRTLSLDRSASPTQEQTLADILPDTDQELPEADLIRRETRDRVKTMVDRLPENAREILLLAYYQQLPYKDIAETLDIPVGTVKSRLHKAVTSFAKLWKAQDDDAE